MRSFLPFVAVLCLALVGGCGDADPSPEPEKGVVGTPGPGWSDEDPGTGHGTPQPHMFDECESAMCNDPTYKFRHPSDPIEHPDWLPVEVRPKAVR